MTFLSPEWFLLIPLLLFAGWFWKSLSLKAPLRIALLLCIVLGLADPHLRMKDNSMDLWVLLDRSASTENLVDQGLPEWRKLLENAKPNSRDGLFFYDYASDIVPHDDSGTSFTGSRELTKSGLALSQVAAMADKDRPARVLLFTDGYSTEPVHEAAEQLRARGIPVDFRLINNGSAHDVQLTRLELPDRVQVGEPFVLKTTLRGTDDGTVGLVIRRANQELIRTTVTIEKGVGRAEFTDRVGKAGAYEYQAEIVIDPTVTKIQDSHPGNNRQQKWLEVSGGPRVLLVSRYPDDPLAQVLRANRYSVDLISDPGKLDLGMLNGARAVIINNVPAHEIPRTFLEGLNFFVREQGGGLMMAGGKHSFGSGGYFESPIDPLLPISMELKNELRKLAVSLVIVMDRSGSMQAQVGSGMTKMDLADAGAAGSIGLLGPMDQVAVLAVDSESEAVVPLTQVGNLKSALQQRVSRIQSQGGGIFVYAGLKAAWEELKKSKTGTKHIILFSDAADSEEPGDYKNLLDEMKKAGVTLSVIGMGTDHDVDADLLKDIAKIGEGRIFFSDNASELPKIFAQETVTVARSAFIEDPVGTQASGRWTEVSPKPIDWLKEVDGYNLSYARPDSTVSLVSTDEYVAPLVAQARRGLGRTAAVSFPLGGESSEKIRAWAQYGDFLQTLTRWLMGQELPPGIGLRHRLDGTRVNLDLLYDTGLWADQIANHAPVLKITEDHAGGAAWEVAWRRMQPGLFSLSQDFAEGSVIRGAVQLADHVIPFGPISLGSSLEWAFNPDSVAELRDASARTGGRELLDLSQAWQQPVRTNDRPLRNWLCTAALVLLLAEALQTRTGWRMPKLARAAKKEVKRGNHPKPEEKSHSIGEKRSTLPENPPTVPAPQSPETPQNSLGSIFDKAKSRK
jgi:Mg-chelatase subunit ChlD/uncharacterized membrane protein